MTQRLDAPVVAFRAWRLRGDELTAVATDTPWPASPRPARCHRDRAHAAPRGDCQCGWYALHEPPRERPGSLVLGAVLAWGRMEVHPAGLRAEFAQPIVLVDDGRHDLRAAARRYGVALCPEQHLELVAAEHGAPVPRTVRAAPDGDVLTLVAEALRRRERGLTLSTTQRDLLDRAGGLAAATPATTLADVLRAAWNEAPAEPAPWGEARRALERLAREAVRTGPWRWTEVLRALGADALAADDRLRVLAREALNYAARARRALVPRGISARARAVATIALRDELPDDDVVAALLGLPPDDIAAVLDASPERRRAWAHGLAARGVLVDARSLRDDLSAMVRRLLREDLDRTLALVHAERRRGRLGHHLDPPGIGGPTLPDLVDGAVRSGLLRPAEAARLADDVLRSTIVRPKQQHRVRQWVLEGPLGERTSLPLVQRLLRTPGVPDAHRVLALRHHPGADPEVARRLWRRAELDAAQAHDVLRATGSLAPVLAAGAPDVPRRAAAMALGLPDADAARAAAAAVTEDDPLVLQRVAEAVLAGRPVGRGGLG